jgi:hypothetical protein
VGEAHVVGQFDAGPNERLTLEILAPTVSLSTLAISRQLN